MLQYPVPIPAVTPKTGTFRSNTRQTKLALAISTTLLGIWPLMTVAQDIEEIVVYADFRGSLLEQLDGSVSVLGETQIEDQNARHLEELLLNAPNINMAGGASRARFYQIRGIGERSQYSEPLNPSVGVLIDGVDFSAGGSATTLYDVEQVEILMGPQGTRYGSNALAGLIHMQSKAPTPTLQYGAQAEVGNYDTRSYAGYISGPLSDNLQLRLSGQQLKSDGYSNNLYYDRPTNNRDESTLRGRLRWEADGRTRLDVSLMHIDIDNGYDVFSLDNHRDTLSDEPGFDRQKSTALNFKLTTRHFDYFTLETIASLAESDIDYGYDEDWVYSGFHPEDYSATDHYFRKREQHSLELRFLSNDNSRLLNDSTDWVAGIYTLDQDVSLERRYTYLATPFHSDFSTERVAAYAETSTALSSALSLDVGLRVERYEARYEDSEMLAFRPEKTLIGGKFALNYQTATAGLLYTSASRGYKTGGFNASGTLEAERREYDAEYLWNYEIGYKGRFVDNRLGLRLALFYMDRSDVQISTYTELPHADAGTEFIDYIGNASSGNNYGLELNSDWVVNSRLSLQASLGLLDTQYEDYNNPNPDSIELESREQSHAPGYQFALGAQFLVLPNLDLSLSWQGRDDFYFSDSHDVRSDSYQLWHASLNYQLNNWRFTLWGRNLGDEDYAVRGYKFGNDPRIDYESMAYTQPGEPRHYGLRVNYDF